MVQVTLALPDGLASQLGNDGPAIERRVLEDVVAEGVRQGRINRAEAAEYLGHASWQQTEQFLNEHDIALDYDSEDLQHDLAVMDRFLADR